MHSCYAQVIIKAVTGIAFLRLVCMYLTHLHQVDSSTTTHWLDRFPVEDGLVSFLLLLCFIEIPVINANGVDPDQMLHSAASYLGLHCLTVTLFEVSIQKWVNPLKTGEP